MIFHSLDDVILTKATSLEFLFRAHKWIKNKTPHFVCVQTKLEKWSRCIEAVTLSPLKLHLHLSHFSAHGDVSNH